MADTGSGSGIGARLRAGREKMGLTQLQAAEKLHVDSKVVENLEAERFDALGAPVFVRGHLKRYAEVIGEQTSELHDLYAAATKPVLPDLTKLPKAAPDSKPSQLAVPALVVLIGFVLVGLVFWVVKSVGGGDGEKPKRGPQPMVIEPDVQREPAVVETPPATTPPVNETRPVAAPPAATSAATTSATTPARAAKPMEVTLRFASDSWVEVYDANGAKLFYDVGTADSSHTVSGTPPFRVTVANAPGVTLDVNGKPAAVPANALKGDEAQFTINRAGRIVRAVPQADGG